MTHMFKARDTLSESLQWHLRSDASTDVDEHAAQLAGWQQQYDQLSAGRFNGQLDQVWTDVAQVFRERCSQALRQHCEVRPDAVWCGITTTADGSRIDGRPVGDSGVMVCGSAAHFELISPPQHDILGIVVARSELERHAAMLDARIAWPLLDHAPWLQVSPRRRHQAQARLRAILVLAETATAAHQRAVAARAELHRAMLDVLVDLFESTFDPSDDRSNSTVRRRLVQRVHEWIEAHPDEVPSVPELCERLHTSRRTLQYAFESEVVMSPAAYLRTIRLNGVRRMLRRAAPNQLTVQEAAAAWGFWHLSQFAADYRLQFGELPSQTLAG